jgi:hypothetical protein
MKSISCPKCTDGRVQYEGLGEVECEFCSEVGYFVIPERCNVCGGNMKEGKAFVNTLVAMSDFGGDAGQRGTTQTRKGAPVLVDVFKCEDCGHSFYI